MEILPQIVLVLVLVFLNGYFVASEFALVAVRKTRIEELVRRGNTSAKLVKKALENLDSFISATQLGITIASLALGWVGEPALAGFFEQFLTFLPKEATFISSHTIAVIIAFFLITFLHIVLGELAPKTVALQKAEKTSLLIIAPLVALTTIFKPFIWLLNGAGSLVLKIFGFTPPSGHQLVHSEEEIKMILSQSAQSGAIKQKEADMVYSVFKLGEIPVKQIMVPRTEIIAFNVALSVGEIIKRIEHTIHSRFPVYEHTIDTVVGFVHIKDLYKQALSTKDKRLAETNLIRKIIYIPETKRIDEVLRDMRKKRVHIAVVSDEYGGTAGIVTLEDVIESLVGEIEDEFEKPPQEIEKLKNGIYRIDGLTAVEKVQKKFNLPLKGQGYTTIGGLVFGILGTEPKIGDTIQIGTLILEIESLDGKRIDTLKLYKHSRRK